MKQFYIKFIIFSFSLANNVNKVDTVGNLLF